MHDRNRHRAMFSWLFMGALLVLCGVLGFLQYLWIGEVAIAERERLKSTLQASLDRLSVDFNSEIAAAVRTLLPLSGGRAEPAAAEVASRYQYWKQSDGRVSLLRRLAVAESDGVNVELQSIDLDTAAVAAVEWPDEWSRVHERIKARLARPDRPPEAAAPGPPPNAPNRVGEDGLVFGVPIMGPRPSEAFPPGPFARRDSRWLIVELNLHYLRETLLPELLRSHLGSAGAVNYMVEVVARDRPDEIIYRSDPDQADAVSANADASVPLLDTFSEAAFRRGERGWLESGRRGPPRSMGIPGRGRGPGGPEAARWEMFVRHRAGSLEAVVSQTRWRNLAVTAGVLLLMMASAGALVRYTRRAQKLAELQMGFVAGVSHELRTPLTVIHTAAYNLRGKLAANVSQVERYGALIQQESGRLKDLVEQVLRFGSAEAGAVVQKREPLAVEAVIEEAVQSTAALLNGTKCELETRVEPGLPLVLGDAVALRHAIQNLVGNAAKYGTEGGNWVGVFASKAAVNGKPMIEIRVADRGPGIPEEEQKHVFDPFFRGRRAIEDQIHGTGLGLSLVKQIVEAHGGEVAVTSKPAERTEFVVRIPAAPPEFQDEFAHTSG